MRAFVKHPGGIEQYECNVEWIPGHNPDLVLNRIDEVERISLTALEYQSQEALHNLLQSKGVVKKATAEVKAEL